jgi:hypothetical protein
MNEQIVDPIEGWTFLCAINHPGRAPCKTPPERVCCILCNTRPQVADGGMASYMEGSCE